jgi:signal transduction histidine kinase
VALTAATVLVHQWRDPLPPLPVGPTIIFWSVVLGSGGLGWILKVRAEDVRKLIRRSELVEGEREQRAHEAVTTERGRIARELHDLVGHGISLMVLQVVRAQESLDRGELGGTRQQLAGLETTARNTLAEMRRLLTVVGEDESPLAPQPGIAEINALVEQVRGAGVPIDLRIVDGASDVPSGIGLAAYRLVQEGLTNVLKHGGRIGDVSVVLARNGDVLSIEVVDQADRPVAEFREGRGLAGMRERVALYGGTLEVGPRPEGRFEVSARLPIGVVD